MELSAICLEEDSSTNNWLTTLARIGYVARALLYFVIGYFSILTLFHNSRTLGKNEALTTILYQPFGRFILLLTAIGLLFYSTWRLTQALRDTDGHGSDLKGLIVRGSLLVSAFVHVSLGIRALQISLFEKTSSDGGWVGWILRQPAGEWVIGFFGIILFVIGIFHIRKGYREDYLKYFTERPSDFFQFYCKVGLISKGVSFGIIGYLTLQVALRDRAGEKQGLQVALNFIGDLNYGWLLVSFMGAGLFSFGIYSALESVYRRIEVN